MSITLNLPDAVIENAKNWASSEGLSLEEFLTRLLVESTERQKPAPEQAGKYAGIRDTSQRLGRLRGTVLYMADDFNEPLEDFKEYME